MNKHRFFGHGFKKGDFLIFALIAAAMIWAAISYYSAPLSATTVKIYVDAKEYATYQISQGYEETVTVQTNFGYNQVKLQSGTVQITESDCINHDCVRMGTISHAGDMLICLPHKLMIVLEGGDAVDAVSY